MTGCLESSYCPLVAARCLNGFFQTEELGQIPGGYTSACVCGMMRVCERPNLSESERGPVGSLRTHVVSGQLRLLQSY